MQFRSSTPLWCRVLIRVLHAVWFALSLVALLARSFGAREIGLLAGIGLLSYGASLIFWPAAFIVPGLILTGVAIFGIRSLGDERQR